MTRRSTETTLLGAVLIGCAQFAPSAMCGQQPTPPVRPLGPIIARSEQIGYGGAVRALSDGRVLGHDRYAHTVVLFDSSLATRAVVADRTAQTGNAYLGGAAIGGPLIPYRADTTLFLQRQNQSLLVIDPLGKIIRTVPAPNLGQTSVNWAVGAATDRQGRVIFRLDAARTGSPLGPASADTAPIVRVDLASRQVDTAAFIKVTTTINVATGATEPGAATARALGVPFQSDDDWALLADGSIAIVRGGDGHVDFVDPQGRRSSGPPIPLLMRRVGDSAKAALVDSMRRADSIVRSGVLSRRYTRPQTLVATADIPDARPLFLPGTTWGDAEGNVWIKLVHDPANVGGAIYLVVNRQGQLVDRVQFPANSALEGFGSGVAYLVLVPPDYRAEMGVEWVVIARARIR